MVRWRICWSTRASCRSGTPRTLVLLVKRSLASCSSAFPQKASQRDAVSEMSLLDRLPR